MVQSLFVRWRATAVRVIATVLILMALGTVTPALAMSCQQALDLVESNLSSKFNNSRKSDTFTLYYFSFERHEIVIACKNSAAFGSVIRTKEDSWSRIFLGRFYSIASLMTGKKTEDIAATLARCESRALKSGSAEELKLDDAPDGAFASCEARDGADFSRRFTVTVH